MIYINNNPERLEIAVRHKQDAMSYQAAFPFKGETPNRREEMYGKAQTTHALHSSNRLSKS